MPTVLFTFTRGRNHVTHSPSIKQLFLLANILFTSLVSAETAIEAPTSHQMHQLQPAQVQLTEAGTDLFATIQEVIRKLSADPNTDWSKVNLEALRQHLRDMFEFSYNVDVISQKPIDQGVKILVKPVTDRAEQALDKVLSAHPMMLKMETGWTMQSSKRDGQYQLIVTTTKPTEVDKIRGLGYIGLLAIGNHHQIHHWSMAKGQNPHQAMHHQ